MLFLLPKYWPCDPTYHSALQACVQEGKRGCNWWTTLGGYQSAYFLLLLLLTQADTAGAQGWPWISYLSWWSLAELDKQSLLGSKGPERALSRGRSGKRESGEAEGSMPGSSPNLTIRSAPSSWGEVSKERVPGEGADMTLLEKPLKMTSWNCYRNCVADGTCVHGSGPLN